MVSLKLSTHKHCQTPDDCKDELIGVGVSRTIKLRINLDGEPKEWKIGRIHLVVDLKFENLFLNSQQGILVELTDITEHSSNDILKFELTGKNPIYSI